MGPPIIAFALNMPLPFVTDIASSWLMAIVAIECALYGGKSVVRDKKKTEGLGRSNL